MSSIISKNHPSNVFKFCPRCGSEKFETTGERSKLCNTCNFNFYSNPAAAVAGLIFNEEGKLLLTRRALDPDIGCLDIPGGFIEFMETAEDALVREVKEELNVDVKSLSYYCSFPNKYLFSELTVFTLDIVYKLELETFKGMVAADDISSFEFHDIHGINLEEIPSLSTVKIIKKLIQDEQNTTAN